MWGSFFEVVLPKVRRLMRGSFFAIFLPKKLREHTLLSRDDTMKVLLRLKVSLLPNLCQPVCPSKFDVGLSPAKTAACVFPPLAPPEARCFTLYTLLHPPPHLRVSGPTEFHSISAEATFLRPCEIPFFMLEGNYLLSSGIKE